MDKEEGERISKCEMKVEGETEEDKEGAKGEKSDEGVNEKREKKEEKEAERRMNPRSDSHTCRKVCPHRGRHLS